MKKSKIRIVMVCMIIICLIFSGCQSSQKTDAEVEPSVAFIATNSAPVIDWDPSIVFSIENQVFFNIYETLLKYEPDTDTFTPVLATDYSKSSDGLVWTFNLRKGVKFHDGTDFNADAVKFSYERTKNMKKGAAYIWDPVESINVIDPYTIEIVTNTPAPIELMVSCAYGAFIMSPTATGDDFEKGTDWFSKGNECGTGPYIIQSQVQGDEVVLTKFEDYWGGWEGKHFDKAVYKLIGENASRRQMLESGEADAVINLMAQDIEVLKNNPDINVVISDAYKNMLTFMNTKKPPLDNVLVRKAMAYAFPYQQVIDYVRLGYASVATDVIPKSLWGANQETPFTYDIEKAKELLEQSGYEPGEIKIKYTYVAGVEDRKKCAELYKAELAKIGVELDIQPMPWDSMWTLAKSPNELDRQDMINIIQWTDLISPIAWYMPMIHSEESPVWNLAYYKNEKVDKLIEEAQLETGIDKDKAAAKFMEAGKLVAEDCPIIYYGDEKAVMLLSKDFKGFTPNRAYQDIIFLYNCYRETE